MHTSTQYVTVLLIIKQELPVSEVYANHLLLINRDTILRKEKKRKKKTDFKYDS